MRVDLAVLFCALLGCVEPPRQALVDLMVEDGLTAHLSTLRVAALDADGGMRGAEAELDLHAPYVRDGHVSFGAVPARDGQLVLRFRGLDETGLQRLEQTHEAFTKRKGLTKLSMTLSADCLDRECGVVSSCAAPASCDGREAPPDAGVDAASCMVGTILDCGGCGQECNMSHVSVATCQSGACEGSCEQGFGDCDEDLRSDGCETNLRSDPKHCGSCSATPCPYGVCADGLCAATCIGRYATTDTSYRFVLPSNRMIGFAITVASEGVLVGLGLNVRTLPNDSDARFRLALYSDDATREQPGRLIDETASARLLERPQVSGLPVCSPSGLELRTPGRVRLKPGRYWMFVIAAGTMTVLAEPFDSPWLMSQNDVDYTELERMPDLPSEYSPLKASLQPKINAYVVTAPVP